MTTVYVLELESKKYYVGQTNDFKKKLEEHKNGKGVEWTQKYKFKCVKKAVPGDSFTENYYTLLYMNMHGVENVRGGIYHHVKLPFESMVTLRRELNHINNKCVACGSSNHLMVNCQEMICYRCGRVGHMADGCAAENHVLNGKLDGCYRCGREGHWKFRCNRSKDIYGRDLEKKCTIL